MNKSNIKYFATIFVILAAVIVLGIALFNTQSTQETTNQSATALDNMIGKPLPNIELTDKDGNKYTAESFKGKNTVLFFSEGIMCYPACWDEIVALAADSRLNNENTTVLSVVTDSPQQWISAKEKMPELNKAILLFDQGSVVSKQLGVINLPSSMHMGSMPGHTYIVLDKQGVVRYVYDDPSMAKNAEKIVSEVIKLNN